MKTREKERGEAMHGEKRDDYIESNEKHVFIKLNYPYLVAFVLIFAMEAAIAIFVDDNFIRPYIGDVLVVVLIYCFIRSFVRIRTKLLPFYIFLFAFLVEVGQYFNLAERLGLGDNRIAKIVIGSTADGKDVACYFIGCLGMAIFEMIVRRRWKP